MSLLTVYKQQMSAEVLQFETLFTSLFMLVAQQSHDQLVRLKYLP